MKLYLYLIAFLMFVVVVFGFVCPALVSATSSELSLLGILILILGIPVALFIGAKAALELPVLKDSFDRFVGQFRAKTEKLEKDLKKELKK